MIVMAIERKYENFGEVVYRKDSQGSIVQACTAVSNRMAKQIANALNLYRPKVRRRKSAEKSK